MAVGCGDSVDQKTLDAWKLFYQSLESIPVVIPYAADIAAFINRAGSLPIASRRAFKRVLATIKTIALVHQRQRLRDDMGRVVAALPHYCDGMICLSFVLHRDIDCFGIILSRTAEQQIIYNTDRDFCLDTPLPMQLKC